jgi:hypothetical protein
VPALDPLSLPINAFLGYVYMKTGRYDQATAACVKAIELDANSLRRTWSSRQNGASRPLPGDRTLIDDFLDRAIFHGNSVEMFIKNPIGKDGDPYLHAAILLGLGLATRGRTVADQGDLEALRDIEGRIEDELRRLEKMEKHNEGIEKVRALTKRVVTDARRASEIIERIRSMVSHRYLSRSRCRSKTSSMTLLASSVMSFSQGGFPFLLILRRSFRRLSEIALNSNRSW